MIREDGERITKSGQKIYRQTIDNDTVIDFAQNPTKDGYSNKYSVRLMSKRLNKGYISLGSITEDSIELIKRTLVCFYSLCDSDIEKFINSSTKVIRGESHNYSLDNLTYTEYEYLTEVLSEIRKGRESSLNEWFEVEKYGD